MWGQTCFGPRGTDSKLEDIIPVFVSSIKLGLGKIPMYVYSGSSQNSLHTLLKLGTKDDGACRHQR
jgi:hypothetical protein